MSYVAYSSLIVLAAFVFLSISITALSHILLLPASIWAIIHFFKIKKFPIKSLSFYSLVALFVAIVLSVLTNQDNLPSFYKSLLGAKYVLLALGGVCAWFRLREEGFFTPQRVQLLLTIFFVSISLATISGLIGLWSGFNPLKMKAACDATRNCGMYGMLMSYAYGIAMVCSVLIAIAVNFEKFKSFIAYKWLFWTTLAISLIGLYFTYTRGAVLGILVTIPFVLWSRFKRIAISIMILVTIFLSVGIVNFVFDKEIRLYRLNSMSGAHERIQLQKLGFAMFKESPFFGVGYKNFENTSRKMTAQPEWSGYYQGPAHNSFIEILAGTGAFGFLAFVCFLAFWVRDSLSSGLTRVIVFPFVLTFVVSSMFQSTFTDGENAFLIMGFWAITTVINLDKQNKKEIIT